jgi:hypothetical protein
MESKKSLEHLLKNLRVQNLYIIWCDNYTTENNGTNFTHHQQFNATQPKDQR